MPADYAQVLKDLDAQIATLEQELGELKAARPTIVLLRNKYSPSVQAPSWTGGRFASMGPTDAIPVLLKDEPVPLTTQQVADKLRAGGVRSKAQDFPASVSATLGQLREKNVVEKLGEGWTLKSRAPEPVNLGLVATSTMLGMQAPDDDDRWAKF